MFGAFHVFLVLLVAAVGQLAWASYLLPRFLSKDTVFGLHRQSAYVSYSALTAKLRSLFTVAKPDPLDEKVREMVIASRMELFSYLLPCALALNTGLLLDDFFQKRRWTVVIAPLDGPPAEVDISQGRQWALLLFRHFVTVLFVSRPGLQNPASIRIGVTLVFVRLVVEAFTLGAADFPAWLASTAPVRVGVSVMLGEFEMAVGMNVVVSLVCCWCYNTASAWHVNFHIYLCLAVGCLIYTLDRARYAQHRADLEARVSHSVEVAADGLLSRMCDAVVHLGEDLRIKQPSPHLTALLLRSSSSGMQGAHFLDLAIGPEESERVREFLLRDSPGADALHASLRDANFVLVRVQLFHICGRDLDDRVFHVVGVREDAESFRMPLEMQAQQEGALGPTVVPLAEHATSDAESVRTLRLENNDGGDLAAYFRPLESGFPMEKCSAGFTVLSGPSAPGARLLDWLVGSEGFVECVQELLDGATNHRGQDKCPAQRSVQVRLRPPHLHQLGRDLCAMAVLSLCSGSGDAEEDQPCTAKLELHDTKVVRRHWKTLEGGLPIRPTPSEKTPSSSAASSIDEGAAWLETPETPPEELDPEAPLDVCFRVFENGYPVTACSPAFATLVALPASEGKLLDVLADAEPLIEKAQMVFNAARGSGDPGAATPPLRVDVHLKLPRPRRTRCRFALRATLELSMAHNAGVENPFEWTVRAELHDVAGVARSAMPQAHHASKPCASPDQDAKALTRDSLRRRPMLRVVPSKASS